MQHFDKTLKSWLEGVLWPEINPSFIGLRSKHIFKKQLRTVTKKKKIEVRKNKLFFENTHGGNMTTFRLVDNGNYEQNWIWNQNLIYEKA